VEDSYEGEDEEGGEREEEEEESGPGESGHARRGSFLLNAREGGGDEDRMDRMEYGGRSQNATGGKGER
jgi:hypothetical protein